MRILLIVYEEEMEICLGAKPCKPRRGSQVPQGTQRQHHRARNEPRLDRARHGQDPLRGRDARERTAAHRRASGEGERHAGGNAPR